MTIFCGHMSSEATPTVTAYEVLAWLETNKKQLIIAFAAAVVVGFAIGIYRYTVDQKELAASDALLKLKSTIGGDEAAASTDPSAFLKVAEQYSGTSAADRAVLLAAGAMFANGKYAEAQAEFSKFLRDQPQSPFAATAGYGVAAAVEAQGKRDEALTAYQNLAVRYPNSSVVEEAKLAVARIYEAKNQPELALRQYDELTKVGGLGVPNNDAASRREALLLKHPELAKTNAPAANATTLVTPAKPVSAVISNAMTLQTNAAAAKP